MAVFSAMYLPAVDVYFKNETQNLTITKQNQRTTILEVKSRV
jgi:hypothetical protein